ncbi:RecQ family ATP-dependent DNA helicase [bacterium]|nr:RecQ family ATP-dependent DNA helicase [bacterium]
MNQRSAALLPPLEAALRDLFGHQSFREGQREALEAVLAGDDVLAVFPTGAGKSLMYQLPAFLLPGATIAVSPLISLMKDQLEKLRARGLPADVVNSAVGQDEQDRIFERLARGETKLIYVAPERFRSARFLRAVERLTVSLFAVDEAHCVSEWGHDFRPDYLRLGEAARSLGRPPVLAVTATATEKVRRDIAASLGLSESHRVLVRGFDRPNLRFSVVPASGEAEKAESVSSAIDATSGEGSVIVYCATRKVCERLASRLSRGASRAAAAWGDSRRPRPQRALVYHAGLGAEERRTVHEAWSGGRSRVVVATNAFGLGIDKEDVRLVVHHDLPGSLEAYYQEAGRAGRDGKPASCVLVFSGADVHLQTFLASGSFPDRACVEAVFGALERAGTSDASDLREEVRGEDSTWSERAVASSLRLLADAGHAREDEGGYAALPCEGELRVDWERLERLRAHEREKLATVLGYARGTVCRRATILRYFGATSQGKKPEPDRCGVCDRCSLPEGAALEAGEAAIVVKKVLSLAARLRGRFGRGVAARLLAGTTKPEDRERGIASLPTVGALAPWSVDACGAAIDACLAHELLVTVTDDGKYPKLALTPLGRDVIFERIELPVPILRPVERAMRTKEKRGREREPREGRSGPASDRPVDRALFESLRSWRRERAKTDGVPPYCVFHDSTLEAIASARPRDLVSLLSVKGLGPRKAEKYGEALLDLVRARNGEPG